MPQARHPRISLDVFCRFSPAGPVTSFPAIVELEHMSSAAPIYFTCDLPSVSECTFAFYSRSVIATRSSVTIPLTIVGPDLVVSRDTFPAGRLTIPSTPTTDVNGETVFLTIATQNQVCTEISMQQRCCKRVRFPSSDTQRGVLGVAGHLKRQPSPETTLFERLA
jgi:hypothetical protein